MSSFEAIVASKFEKFVSILLKIILLLAIYCKGSFTEGEESISALKLPYLVIAP